MHRNTEFVIGWIHRMAERWGGIVYEDGANNMDWGQALCRERYGAGWAKMELPDDPDDEAVEIARRWEAGEWPDWATTAKRDALTVRPN